MTKKILPVWDSRSHVWIWPEQHGHLMRLHQNKILKQFIYICDHYLLYLGKDDCDLSYKNTVVAHVRDNEIV